MVWWIVGGTAVAAVAFVIWIWLELVNAPTIDDDAGAEKEHLDEHVKTEEKAASD